MQTTEQPYVEDIEQVVAQITREGVEVTPQMRACIEAYIQAGATYEYPGYFDFELATLTPDLPRGEQTVVSMVIYYDDNGIDWIPSRMDEKCYPAIRSNTGLGDLNLETTTVGEVPKLVEDWRQLFSQRI